jgi:hypothetical protein
MKNAESDGEEVLVVFFWGKNSGVKDLRTKIFFLILPASLGGFISFVYFSWTPPCFQSQPSLLLLEASSQPLKVSLLVFFV